MTPEEFIEAYKEAFGADTQLPIAFGYSDEPLTEPKEGLRCLMGLFPKVRRGDTVTLADKFISCGGGMLYMGTGELQDRIPNFVSNIEHYQQTPQMVRDYVEGLHLVPAPKQHINFQRADKLNSWEDIEGLIFFAKPDVLSGLCAWAFFDDNSESAVITRFASGCASLITMAVAENRKEDGHSCFLGGFDPSARIMMPADEMTFVIPAVRLGKMLHTMRDTCLFDTPAWGKIRQRIEKPSTKETLKQELENVAFAATVCDKDGIVLYQNAVARHRDGEVIGKNLYNCHSPKSGEKIRMMMETGMSNSYEVIHHGKHYFVHHTPWFTEPGGELSGLIELDIEIPESHPTFNRDKE